MRLSELAYRQHDLAAAGQAAESAYAADRYLENAPVVLWRLFATSYDQSGLPNARKWCDEGARRFPDNARFARCRILVMTMNGATVEPARLWAAYDDAVRLTPAPDRAFDGRFDRILLAAALARVPGMADSARAVLAGARADRTIDPQGELRGYEAFARVALGEHEEAIRLLDAYLRENPSHREGFSRINAWWWGSLKQDPRFVRLIGAAQ